MPDKPNLFGFNWFDDGTPTGKLDGTRNGYKGDGRGTWYNNGDTAIWHSVDRLPDAA